MNPEAEAKVVVRRTLARGMKVRSLDLSLDRDFWVDLQFGQSVERLVPPGSVLITVSNRLFTKHAMFDLKAGETLVLEVGNQMGGCGLVLTGLGLPFYGVFIERQPVEPEG